MSGYPKIIILVVILAVLLIAVLSLQKKEKSEQRQIAAQQESLFFPDVELEDVSRVEINSLQQGSLLLRKNAGVWEVASGRDIMAELMAKNEEKENEQAEDTGDSIEPVGEEEQAEDSVTPDDSDLTDEADDGPGFEQDDAQDTEVPSIDTGPSGDQFRTFYKADQEKVEQIVESVVNLKMGTLVTSNTEKHASFKVLNNIVGTEIILYDSETNRIAEIIVGDQGSTFTTTYVRHPESDEVREVTGNLKMALNVNLNSLRDRQVFDAPPETILSLEVKDHSDNSGFEISRSEGIWEGTSISGEPLELDVEKIDNILQKIGTLEASEYIDKSDPRNMPQTPEDGDSTDPWGILHPTVEIEFTTTDGETKHLVVGREEGTRYYAATYDNLNDLFWISGNTVDSITPDPAELAPGEDEETDGSLEKISAEEIGDSLITDDVPVPPGNR